LLLARTPFLFLLLRPSPPELYTLPLRDALPIFDAAAQADVTARYQTLCAHYGMQASRNNRGRGHENGSIEAPHGHLKRRIKQRLDRKSTRLNSSHVKISYAVFCLKKKTRTTRVQ